MWRERSTTTPVVSDWPLVPGAAAARRQDDGAEALLGQQPHDAGDVVRAAREQDRLRRQAIDRIVGREDHAVSVLGRDVAREPRLCQRDEKPGDGLVGRRGFGKSRDHAGLPVSSTSGTIVIVPCFLRRGPLQMGARLSTASCQRECRPGAGGRGRSGAQTIERGTSARLHIVGIENSAPSFTPEGQRAVTFLVLV